MNHRILSVMVVLDVSLLLVACQVPLASDRAETVDTIVQKATSAVGAIRDSRQNGHPLTQLNTGEQPARLPSTLSLSLPEAKPAGTAITVDALLTNLEGAPQSNKVLNLQLNGEQVRRMRTDEQGRAQFYVGRDLLNGTYQVKVIFEGTEVYEGSSAAGTFVVSPAALTIRTVPPVEKIGFVMDGQTGYTNEEGVVHFDVAAKGIYKLFLLPLPEPGIDVPMLIQFERWADGVFFPHREVQISGDEELVVGLALSHQIGVSFVDLAGRPVDPTRISSITLKSSHGTRFTYLNGYPRWLKANRVARLKNGLEATKIQYAVESVIVDGTNVVNQNQQRFLVERDDTWPVELLLYSAKIRARDAVFGFPIATGIDVKHPDGHVKSYELDENSEVFIDSLARGDYTIQATGVGGIAPETPVSLSRDQDVVLKVLSTFDMAVGVGLGVIIALGLLLYGRPELVSTPTAALVGLLGFLRQRSRLQPRPVAFRKQVVPGRDSCVSSAGDPAPAAKHRT